MKLLLKIIIPVLIFIGFVYGAKLVRDSAPEPFRRPSRPNVQAVEATRLDVSDYAISIESQGNVQPTVATSLVPEVLGSISLLSESFVVGGAFKKGDVLIQIDERDYQIALTQARANLASMDAQLQQEKAQSQLAREEWESLRKGKKASALTLRQPQLAAARANLNAARASVTRAELDLSRTKLIAPYDGMVLERQVDLGQFVNRGTPVGRIYSTQSVDVRLPISSRQLSFLNLPENGADASGADKTAVLLRATVGDTEHEWNGWVERVEGIDTGTQQFNVIARIESPMTIGDIPLRVGQYVNATLTGKIIKDVFVIPRQALRENNEVLTLDSENKIVRTDVSVVWSDESVAAINGGLEKDTVLVTTPLATVTNGTPVRPTIDGVAPPPPRNRQGQGGDGSQQRGQGNGEGGDGTQQRRQGNGEGGDGTQQRRQGNGEGGDGTQQRRQGNGQGGDGTQRRRQGNGEAGDGTQRRRQGNGEGGGQRQQQQGSS